MNTSICQVCNVKLEDDEAITSHRCWIITDEYSDEYGNLERNMLPNALESQVSSAGAITRTHIGTRFPMRNDPFQIGKDQNATEISEKISKHPSESIGNSDFFNALCELDPIFDSNSEQQSTNDECRSEQTIPRSKHPLPLISVPFPHAKNLYKFPTDPSYSIQVPFQDIISKETYFAPDKVSNFDMTSSASFKNISESRTYNLDRNILPVLPSNTMSASNTTHDDRLNRDSINRQAFLKVSFSKNSSFEENELHNLKKLSQRNVNLLYVYYVLKDLKDIGNLMTIILSYIK
ncbi:hypothetical protein NPIL_587611 [Nephila pilipes]|uniref:Uncharacterized protein n=1 Tax=Nephila pilipes TaxID=299642 RepID=A0A8X6NPM0_NEPPI|nr:hypothetical protein NPIL_587611 [Nephila pilipes]